MLITIVDIILGIGVVILYILFVLAVIFYIIWHTITFFCLVSYAIKHPFVTASTIGIIAIFIGAFHYKHSVLPKMATKAKPSTEVVSKTKAITPAGYTLSTQHQATIDSLLRRATHYVERGQYTYPPNRSAKDILDRIRKIDPKGHYLGADIRKLIDRIVDDHITLAHKSHKNNNMAGVTKWLNRGKLFNRNSQLILEKEREYDVSAFDRFRRY